MLMSIALIFLLGLTLGHICERLNLPGLVGMIIAGIILGPSTLNLLDPITLKVAPDLRQLALIIILTRAGLSLDIDDLKRNGRPAMFLCFLPACFEILGIIFIAPKIFDISLLDAAIMGSVVAAVSPAVIVPRMISIMEQGYGRAKGVPQMILASASVDDIFVIALFTSLTSLAIGKTLSLSGFLQIPISILLGIIVGSVLGFGLTLFFNKVKVQSLIKTLILISLSCILVVLEGFLQGKGPISGLLAIMAIGLMIHNKDTTLAAELSNIYNKLWIAAEILLFVLVGAAVDIHYAFNVGFAGVILILISLLFRMVGVWVSLLRSKLEIREKLFCMIAYTPKATVQAAIGTIPLSMNLDCGQIVLTVAVLSILITAPLGAIGIDKLYPRLLERS